MPDHGEESYEGSGKLTGRAAIFTGGDSGIGKAVAIAFAREGADILISYLPEEQPDTEDKRNVRFSPEHDIRPTRSAHDCSHPTSIMIDAVLHRRSSSQPIPLFAILHKTRASPRTHAHVEV